MFLSESSKDEKVTFPNNRCARCEVGMLAYLTLPWVRSQLLLLLCVSCFSNDAGAFKDDWLCVCVFRCGVGRLEAVVSHVAKHAEAISTFKFALNEPECFLSSCIKVRYYPPHMWPLFPSSPFFRFSTCFTSFLPKTPAASFLFFLLFFSVVFVGSHAWATCGVLHLTLTVLCPVLRAQTASTT